ncbi:hypothetical protein [Streptomyces spiralis]|uniref:hypothetical protein n=1 Tax=Streptomyces spiralis TaxID=66376 RepID=UPI00188B5A60|nr:hypothetical protein [Streptomyces spiralis]
MTFPRAPLEAHARHPAPGARPEATRPAVRARAVRARDPTTRHTGPGGPRGAAPLTAWSWTPTSSAPAPATRPGRHLPAVRPRGRVREPPECLPAAPGGRGLIDRPGAARGLHGGRRPAGHGVGAARAGAATGALTVRAAAGGDAGGNRRVLAGAENARRAR